MVAGSPPRPTAGRAAGALRQRTVNPGEREPSWLELLPLAWLASAMQAWQPTGKPVYHPLWRRVWQHRVQGLSVHEAPVWSWRQPSLGSTA